MMSNGWISGFCGLCSNLMLLKTHGSRIVVLHDLRADGVKITLVRARTIWKSYSRGTC
jgi:hypothetical protein